MRAEYLDHMGDDLAVVNAARVSFDKESDWLYDLCDCDIDAKDAGEDCNCQAGRYLAEGDSHLISYLARNGHWTPFAHTAIKLRMGAPVPIRTQCFKHKAGFVENEESRRYIDSKPELFVPVYFRTKADKVKQGSGGIHESSDKWLRRYCESAEHAIDLYSQMINDGVCPEQARFVLPQGVIVNWIWTGSLAAYARFYRQRTHSHAQQEARELAAAVGGLIQPLFPVSWAALTAGERRDA